MRRRRLLEALVLAPAALAATAPAEATEYASAAEALAAVDLLEAEVDRRLRSVAAALPSARRLADSFLADHEAHRVARAEVRRRLRLPAEQPAPAPAAAADDRSVSGLRKAQERLVYAHAEGLPALGDESTVDILARHMVDESRHLAVLALWLDAESDRG